MKLNTRKAGIISFIAIINLVTAFLGTGAAKTFLATKKTPAISKKECVRFLLMTSRRLVENHIVPNTDEGTFNKIDIKKIKLLNGFDMAMTKGYSPSPRELRKLSCWIESFFKMFARHRVYAVGSMEGQNLSVSMGLAQRYLDCARYMISGKE